MRAHIGKTGLTGVANYEHNYMELPFENIMREYRKKNTINIISRYPHAHFLEIGCGADPLFIDIHDFSNMVVIEPGKLFYDLAISKSKLDANPNIVIINDLIENTTEELSQYNFDFVVIGGFLHEIKNPDVVLQVVKKLCKSNTIVYSFVPNSKSFHRLLAYEMGIIKSLNQKSSHDWLFQRQSSYDINSFNQLLINNGFVIRESGSYFIKPFT